VKLLLNDERLDLEKIKRDYLALGNLEIAKLCIESGKFDVNHVFGSACYGDCQILF